MKINGEEIVIGQSVTLSQLLSERGYTESRIAVELNGKIVPKSAYAETLVSDGDELEVVRFVGGG